MRSAFFFFSILLWASASAESFQFETIRTQESPGFFAIRLFADENTTPLDIQNVFVTNFMDAESVLYDDLLLVINELGYQVISPEELGEYVHRANYRFVFLGEPSDIGGNFKILDMETAIEDFEKFSIENLGPVFFQNIVLTFGGNVKDVYPKKIDFLSSEPILLVGKFESPMQTLAQISATSSVGEITASAVLDLREYYDDPLVGSLPDEWQALASPSLQNGFGDLRWLAFFPWILGGVGFSFIFSLIINKTTS